MQEEISYIRNDLLAKQHQINVLLEGKGVPSGDIIAIRSELCSLRAQVQHLAQSVNGAAYVVRLDFQRLVN